MRRKLINKYLKQTELSKVKSWIATKVAEHLEKNEENEGEIEHIIDYFNSKDCPGRLDAISYKVAVGKSKKWLEKLVQQGNRVIETDADTAIEIDFKDGMRLVK